MDAFKYIEHKNFKMLYIGIRSNGIGSKGYHLENLNPYASPLFSQNLLFLPGTLTKRSHKFRFLKDKLDVIPHWTLLSFRSYSNLDLIPTLCNSACKKFRSYSIRSYSLDLVPTYTTLDFYRFLMLFRSLYFDRML